MKEAMEQTLKANDLLTSAKKLLVSLNKRLVSKICGSVAAH